MEQKFALAATTSFNQRKTNIRHKLNQNLLKKAIQDLAAILRESIESSSVQTLPICFISHADDKGEHTQWATWLGKLLVKSGFEVILDVWQHQCGQEKTKSNEMLLSQNPDFVLVVGTRLYSEQYGKTNGPGLLEARLLNYMMLDDKLSKRIIPILLEKTAEKVLPPFMQIKLPADFSQCNYNFSLCFDLIRQMHENIIKEKFNTPQESLIKIQTEYKKITESLQNGLEVVERKQLEDAQQKFKEKVLLESHKLTRTNERHINAILEKQLLNKLETKSSKTEHQEPAPTAMDQDDINAIVGFMSEEDATVGLMSHLDIIHKNLELLSNKYGHNLDKLLLFYQLSLAYKKSGVKPESVSKMLQTTPRRLVSEYKHQTSDLIIPTTLHARGFHFQAPEEMSQPSKPFLHKLPERNRDFYGREQELKGLIAFMTENSLLQHSSNDFILKMIALTGIGGVGKTQIALELIYQLLEYPSPFYSCVAWLDAEKGLFEEYNQLMESCDLKIQAVGLTTYKSRYASLLAKFKGPILIIFDNVKDLEEIKNFLPADQAARSRIRFIIISQSQVWSHEHFHLMSVSGYSEQESVECIVKHLPGTDKEMALALAKTLHLFPLAIYQALSYLEHTSCSINDYLTEYHSQKKLFLSTSGEMTQTNKNTVYSTLKMALSRVEQKLKMLSGSDPENIEKLWSLLKICAFLNSTDITNKMLHQLVKEVHFNQLKMLLNSFSLIKISKDLQSISFHPLVQELIRADIEQEPEGTTKWIQAAFSLINNSIQFNYDLPGNWGAESNLLMHARTVKLYAKLYKVELGKADLLMQESLFKQEDHSESEHALQKIKAALLSEQQTNTSSLRLIKLRTDMADVLRSQGKFEKAIQNYQKALSTARETNNKETEACLQLKLGHVYRESGDYKSAKDVLEVALLLYSALYSADDSHVGLIHHYLGLVAHAMGDYTKAIEHYNTAFSLLETYFGKHHPALARPINGLGLACCHIGKYREGATLFIKALSYYQEYRLFRNAQLETGVIKLNLTNAYLYSGDFQSARTHCAEALSSLTGNPKIVFVYFAASRTFEEEGLLVEALESLEEVYRWGKHYFDVKLTKIMSNVSNPSITWQPLNSEDSDYRCYEKIADLTSKIFGKQHRETAYALNKLGMFYLNGAEYEKASDCFNQALAICIDLGYSKTHPNLQLIQTNLDFSTNENGLYMKRQKH